VDALWYCSNNYGVVKCVLPTNVNVVGLLYKNNKGKIMTLSDINTTEFLQLPHEVQNILLTCQTLSDVVFFVGGVALFYVFSLIIRGD